MGVLDWLVGQSLILETCLVGALFFVLIYLLNALRTGWKQYTAFRTVPTDPDQHILLGHTPRMLSDMGTALDWFSGLQTKHGWKTIKLVMGPMWYQLVCLHPDTAKVALRSDPKSDIIYNALLPWLGEGVLIANDARWARSRRLLTPAFHFDILKPYVQVFSEATNDLVDIWSKVPEGQSVNIFPNISLLTLDVMLRCICSYHSNCQTSKTHDPYIQAVYDLSALAVRRILFIPAYFDLVYALTPDGWRNRRACSIVHQFSLDVIQRRRKALEEMKRRGEDPAKGTKKKYLDFIDIVLEAKDEDGRGLTDQEIRAEVDTFMFEGHDTTASGIAWTLYNLAKYPEHQEKCRQEVDAILDQKDMMDWDDLKQLTYLKYCIKESLRLYPPVCAVGRELAQETEINGRVFPKGTEVAIMIYAIHRAPDIWENPEEFDPLRFTPENSKHRHPYAFITFSAGPRNCIGQEFAMSEMKVTLSNILHNFELSLDPSRPPQKDLQIILRSKNGLYLKLKRRSP